MERTHRMLAAVQVWLVRAYRESPDRARDPLVRRLERAEDYLIRRFTR